MEFQAYACHWLSTTRGSKGLEKKSITLIVEFQAYACHCRDDACALGEHYLDDDNIIHPNLYNLLNNIDNNTIYSFNQYNRIKGNNINIGYIDTAMIIIPFNLCKNIIWKLDIYEADGYYIKDCIDSNRYKHVYIDEDLCYYNF